MNYEIFFLIALFSLSSAQGWDWATFDIKNGGSNTKLAANAYFDYYVALIAGTKYNIFIYGYIGFDTTLTATDPSGYQAFNDDWGGSYYANGVYNTGSSMLDFTPKANGITKFRIQAKVSSDTGQFYFYITGLSCSANCLSNFRTIFLRKTEFLGCVATNGVCSMCEDGYKCSSCPSGQFQLEGTCTGTCPPGTYGAASICRCKMLSFNFNIINISLFFSGRILHFMQFDSLSQLSWSLCHHWKRLYLCVWLLSL